MLVIILVKSGSVLFFSSSKMVKNEYFNLFWLRQSVRNSSPGPPTRGGHWKNYWCCEIKFVQSLFELNHAILLRQCKHIDHQSHIKRLHSHFELIQRTLLKNIGVARVNFATPIMTMVLRSQHLQHPNVRLSPQGRYLHCNRNVHHG